MDQAAPVEGVQPAQHGTAGRRRWPGAEVGDGAQPAEAHLGPGPPSRG